MAIVYLHRRKDTNEVFYVGIATRKDRPTSKRSRSIFWKGVAKKYGYTVEIFASGISKEKAKEIEIELIAKYGRRDIGEGSLVNLTDGGDGLANINDETRRKMGAANIGKPSWNKGKSMGDEVKAKVSQAKMGCISPRKGVKLSEEQKLKMSKAKMGKPAPWNSYKRSEELKKKMSVSKTQFNYIMKDRKTNEVIRVFESMSEAIKASGSDRSSITRAANGKRKSAGGYLWERISKDS